MSAAYVTTARAKGVRETRVIFRHVLRNALPPIANVAGGTFMGMANGAIVVETIYGWPGLGKLMIDAIEKRDFAVTQATVLVVAVLVMGVNLIVDMICAATDPRIRLG
jgi:peptide/nickel transport system permease protein